MDFAKLIKTPVKFLMLLIIALWVLSPVDPLPEALLGPLGIIDDIALIGAGLGMLQGKGVMESFTSLGKRFGL